MAIYTLGEYTKVLVVFGAAAHIRLLCPPETPRFGILGFLGYMAEIGDSWLGCGGSVFWPVHLVLLLDWLYLVQQCAFSTLDTVAH